MPHCAECIFEWSEIDTHPAIRTTGDPSGMLDGDIISGIHANNWNETANKHSESGKPETRCYLHH